MTTGTIIVQTNSAPLTNENRKILITLRNRKLKYLLTTYLSLLCVLAMAWVIAVSGGLNRKSVLLNNSVKVEAKKAQIVAPVLFSFFILVLTIFFLKYYFQTVHRYNKDIKANLKNIIEFESTKYSMPVFNRYYLKTPVEQKQVVEISKDIYESLKDHEKLFFEIAPFSSHIFDLKKGDRSISYF